MMKRIIGARIVRCAAASVLVAGTPFVALAQVPRDSTGTRDTTAAGAIIGITPVRPTQGSVVRITLRIPPEHPDSVGAERADSAPSPRPDSLAADSLKVKADSSRMGPVRPDSLRPGSVRLDSLIPDSLRADSLRPDVVRPDSLRTDSTSTGARRDRITAIRGTLFGEPLHFFPDDSGTWSAIGGIPVDAPRSLRLPLIVERAGTASDTITSTLAIGRTAYRMEKLTVAPRFSQAPDSALNARIARERALAAAVSEKSHETPRLWTGEFAHPRQARVTSRFGDGREFNGTVQSRHMGLDLAGAVGAPVLAPDRGVVALVGDFYYAGNAVYIDHGAGLVTAYFHLSKVDVAEGDTVAVGDTIGRVGATGRVTGPHLHWVARYGAVTVDPSSLSAIGPARRDP